jgi:hypothetical protein
MVSGEGLSAFKGTPVEQVWSHALVPHPRPYSTGQAGSLQSGVQGGLYNCPGQVTVVFGNSLANFIQEV